VLNLQKYTVFTEVSEVALGEISGTAAWLFTTGLFLEESRVFRQDEAS